MSSPYEAGVEYCRNGIAFWTQPQETGPDRWGIGTEQSPPAKINQSHRACFRTYLAGYRDHRNMQPQDYSAGPSYDGDMNGAWILYRDGSPCESAIDDLRALGIGVTIKMAQAIADCPHLDALLSGLCFQLRQFDDFDRIRIVGAHTGGVVSTRLDSMIDDVLETILDSLRNLQAT